MRCLISFSIKYLIKKEKKKIKDEAIHFGNELQRLIIHNILYGKCQVFHKKSKLDIEDKR